VFLVRSIRRRLVTGFVVAMLLMLTLAGAGILGLLWHQDAVDSLDFVINRSPDRARVSREISRISEQLFQPVDLNRASAADFYTTAWRHRLETVETELNRFRSCVDDLPVSVQLRQQQFHVLSRIDGLAMDTGRLSGMSNSLWVILNDKDEVQLARFREKVQISIAAMQKVLDNLPAYEERRLTALSAEKKRSEKLLTLIVVVAAVAVVAYGLTMYLGFLWISVPLRNVAVGAIRIANGDISYRIPTATPWQDEFSDVVNGVNRMADRFQEAEQDLQARVRERSEQLVRSHKLANVGFLAAGVAHEINNPLSIIGMAAESIEMRFHEISGIPSEESEDILHRMAMIRAESRRCGEITRKLLDFSRGERSEKCNADLSQVVLDVLSMVQHMREYSDRVIQFDRKEPLYVEMNAAQMKQIILNLVANALHATPPGGHILINVQEKTDYVNVLIQDDGCGMDAETLHHIFDPFYSTKEAGHGTGLGLSITHRLIEDHHGAIIPTSDGPGCGSTFRVRLPRRQPLANAA
jgi:two-component system NtrC family sensor kinase